MLESMLDNYIIQDREGPESILLNMEIRKVLSDPNTFGLQQYLQWFWLTACNILTSMHLVSSVFISATPKYRLVFNT